jgi:hypothetical protein
VRDLNTRQECFQELRAIVATARDRHGSDAAMQISARKIIAGTAVRADEVLGDERAGEVLSRLDAANLAIVDKSDLEILIDAAQFRERLMNGQLLTEHMELALFLGERFLSSSRKYNSDEKDPHLLMATKP